MEKFKADMEDGNMEEKKGSEGNKNEINGEVKGGGGGGKNNDATEAANNSSQFLQVPKAASGGGGGGATIGDGGDDDEEFVPAADHAPGMLVMELKDLDDVAEERDQWGNPLQFFCTILGFCVGLGNIWRFPYLCQANGGGNKILPCQLLPYRYFTVAYTMYLSTVSFFLLGKCLPYHKCPFAVCAHFI